MPAGNTALKICNDALGLLGVRVGYLDSVNDNTREGQLCRLFYNVARQIVIRSFPFHNHLSEVTLAGKTANASLTEEVPYAYRYDYPDTAAVDPDGVPDSDDEVTADVLRLVELVDGTKIRHAYKGYHYRHIGDYIYTNLDSAKMRVIVDDPTPTADFLRSTALVRRAIATKLASMLALPITGDPKLMMQLMQEHAVALRDAMVNAGNRGNTVQAPPESEFISERLGG